MFDLIADQEGSIRTRALRDASSSERGFGCSISVGVREEREKSVSDAPLALSSVPLFSLWFFVSLHLSFPQTHVESFPPNTSSSFLSLHDFLGS